MLREDCFDRTSKRVSTLLDEVRRKEHEIDRLPNSSYEFSEERQALYFSNARKNMKSEMAHITMDCGQQLEDLRVLGEMVKYE